MKPSISDVRDCFRSYLDLNPGWGSLHIVLEDGNVSDANVRFCVDYAQRNGDLEGERLALILLEMSKTQRRKLPYSLISKLNDVGFPLSASV
jgi:hypothetical protein